MRINIKGESKEIQVTTVILSTDYSDTKGEKTYMFHCPRCGNKIIQYQGHIAKIYPGLVPYKINTILMCSNNKCKQRYIIKDIVS
jgi:predicted RNA-binding Zn-ribbon protein involved in translation (DUF1610 family)